MRFRCIGAFTLKSLASNIMVLKCLNLTERFANEKKKSFLFLLPGSEFLPFPPLFPVQIYCPARLDGKFGGEWGCGG